MKLDGQKHFSMPHDIVMSKFSLHYDIIFSVTLLRYLHFELSSLPHHHHTHTNPSNRSHVMLIHAPMILLIVNAGFHLLPTPKLLGIKGYLVVSITPSSWKNTHRL
uniref:Uncharacterized protein n=1 Tax=Setaria viridis TaxID=4556 RepID=A0A4U6V2B4_SETVI|nr:hypothetical protein SEVIR_4G232300v2 [Setaria viridis]